MIRRLSIVVALVAIVVSACTDDAQAPSPTDTPVVSSVATTSQTTTTIPPDIGADEFRQCLSEHGVEIEVIPQDATGRPRLDLATEGLDFDDPVVDEAMAACSGILGNGSLDLSEDELLRTYVVAQLTTFSECVRDKGVEDFPDPIPGFSGVGSAYSPAEIPWSDPALPAALEVCRDRVLGELPAG